jgi:hypothetical protein
VNKTAETGTGMELSYLPSSKLDVSMIIPSDLNRILDLFTLFWVLVKGACMKDIAESFWISD